MFKRMMTLALALVLLACLVPARAEEAVPPQLYRIVLREASGVVTLGSGVLFGSSGTLLTAAGIWAEGDLYAIGADGEHAISYRGTVPGSQLITLGLATPSAAEPMAVTTADYLMDYNLYGVKADGSFVAMEVLASRNTVIDNRGEVLLYAQEGLLPGAVMLGDDDGLACLSVWQQGEGEGVYAAIADTTLSRLFPAQEADATEGLLQEFTARYQDGLIIVDWADAVGVEIAEDTLFTVYTVVTGNLYVTWDQLTHEATSVTFPAAPDTEVTVWIAATRGEPEEVLYPENAGEAIVVSIPPAEPFTLYGLTNLRMSIAPGQPGLDGVIMDFLPQEAITREMLADRSRAIYFQTEDVYACDAEDDGHTLLVTLYTPEGHTFNYHSGYVFMPEYAGSDMWMSDISALFEDYERFCEAGPWPAGEYIVLYTIDGGEVARFTFTLE